MPVLDRLFSPFYGRGCPPRAVLPGWLPPSFPGSPPPVPQFSAPAQSAMPRRTVRPENRLARNIYGSHEALG